MHMKFNEVPLANIEPSGWLRNYLINQRNGLTGHLDEIGYPFSNDFWGNPKPRYQNKDELYKDDWAPYEQTGYWIDGMLRCGYLLKDKFLINKSKKYVENVLKNTDADGYLGPAFQKIFSNWNRWPHAVFFRTMMAYHSATGDKRILKALSKHYLSGTSTHNTERNVCNIEIMLWLYSKTKNRRLLDCAVKNYDEYNRIESAHQTSMQNLLSAKRPTIHGVTYNESAKIPAILYMYTGKKKYLDATVNAYRKIDKYSMLIDGVCSSAEDLQGKDPLDCHETCDIADYTWSAGYLLLATGKVEYADKIERACYNAAPGAVTKDFKALQYFSCPNQVLADYQSNHNFYQKGRNWLSYRPVTSVPCCTGEVHRTMPNFISRMWLADADNPGNIVAAMYGASRVTFNAGKNRQKVTIIEETQYPFSETIKFRFKTAKPASFVLKLRIPGWCSGAKISVNNQILKIKPGPGTFAEIQRTFIDNDIVTLVLPMKIKASRWPRGGVGIERGPLVFALPITEKRLIDKNEKRSTARFPAWNMYPASPWNYAIAMENLQETAEIIRTKSPACPVKLRIPARKVMGWEIKREKSFKYKAGDDSIHTLKGDFSFTPQLPDPKTLPKMLSKKTEIIELVPYGCTNLRITIFPDAG